MYKSESAKAMDDDEEIFAASDEIAIPDQVRSTPLPIPSNITLYVHFASVQSYRKPSSKCLLAMQVYWWHDKYRPRKPRYFNRVKTGYEWNKYNQTHYDHDNPPPKVVQGYKFSIFYPDLIDKHRVRGFGTSAPDIFGVYVQSVQCGSFPLGIRNSDSVLFASGTKVYL